MGTFASGERKTIERLCCYIKDDSMIATYVGVPKSEVVRIRAKARRAPSERSEEHTSELQSLMRISYAVFCLKKKNITNTTPLTKKLYIINKQTYTHSTRATT